MNQMSSSGSQVPAIFKGIGLIFGGSLLGVISQQLINLFTSVPSVVGTILLVGGVGGGALGGFMELYKAYFPGSS